MDTLETYIKMCDCLEIQEQWFLRDGDWQASKNGVVSINHIQEDDDYYSFAKLRLIHEDYVWLPRQDQIQEMLDKGITLGRFIVWYELYLHEIRDKKHIKLESMEQLWLAFYMHEERGKVWDGEKWVKK